VPHASSPAATPVATARAKVTQVPATKPTLGGKPTTLIKSSAKAAPSASTPAAAKPAQPAGGLRGRIVLKALTDEEKA